MAKYPEWLEKMWEEQQSIIGTEGEAITPEVRLYSMPTPSPLECCILLWARALKEKMKWLRVRNICSSSTGHVDYIEIIGCKASTMLLLFLLVHMTHGRSLLHLERLCAGVG
jgi:hypothetical protein